MIVLLCLFLSACEDDGAYKKETNREAFRKKKINGILYEWLKRQGEIR